MTDEAKHRPKLARGQFQTLQRLTSGSLDWKALPPPTEHAHHRL